MAIHFAIEGADVVIVYKNETADARITAQSIERNGRRCLTLAGDIGDRSFCRRCVRKTINAFRNTPMGRPGQPAEVAPCFVFLASDDASYMTGQVLHPNGGDYMSS